MPKKKHRKKVKRASPRKVASHSTHLHHSKRGKHHAAHAKAEPHSLSLLRAIKRRRAAEHGEHLELAGVRRAPHHSHKKRGKAHHSLKRAHHHAEPVVTEKSFENMLAFRRFQNHAR
jgi:hypothetical protein